MNIVFWHMHIYMLVYKYTHNIFLRRLDSINSVNKKKYLDFQNKFHLIWIFINVIISSDIQYVKMLLINNLFLLKKSDFSGKTFL